MQNNYSGSFVWSQAAEAQESLEKEALAQVEKEVRLELAQNLEGEEVCFLLVLFWIISMYIDSNFCLLF